MSYLNYILSDIVVEILIYLDIKEYHNLNKMINNLDNILSTKIFWIKKLIQDGLKEYIQFFPLTKPIVYTIYYNIINYNIIKENNKIIMDILDNIKNQTLLYTVDITDYKIDIVKLIQDYSQELFKEMISRRSKTKKYVIKIFYHNTYNDPIYASLFKKLLSTNINTEPLSGYIYCYLIYEKVGDRVLKRGLLSDEEMKLLYIKSVFYIDPYKNQKQFTNTYLDYVD